MPRGTRLDVPGSIQHVIARGIRREAIFRDDWDRRDYLARLDRISADAQLSVFAWALMENHVHLVVRTSNVPLSHAMQRLGSGYARSFNRRHDRVGYLFQGRYESIRVDDDAYLLLLLRYVHRNPIEAGIVRGTAELESYPWTSYPVLLGRQAPRFESVEVVLSFFGDTPRTARRELREFMRVEGEASGDAPLPARGLDGAPIHRDASLSWSEAGARSALASLGADPRAGRLALSSEWCLDRVIRYVCAELSADPDAVRAGRRTRRESLARAAICFLAHTELGWTLAGISAPLGVSTSGLSRALARGGEVVEEFALRLDP